MTKPLTHSGLSARCFTDMNSSDWCWMLRQSISWPGLSSLDQDYLLFDYLLFQLQSLRLDRRHIRPAFVLEYLQRSTLTDGFRRRLLNLDEVLPTPQVSPAPQPDEGAPALRVLPEACSPRACSMRLLTLVLLVLAVLVVLLSVVSHHNVSAKGKGNRKRQQRMLNQKLQEMDERLKELEKGEWSKYPPPSLTN